MSEFSINYKSTSVSSKEIKDQSKSVRIIAETIRSCDRALHSSTVEPEIHEALNKLLRKTINIAANEASFAAALNHISKLYSTTETTIIKSAGYRKKVTYDSNSKTNNPGTEKRGVVRKIIDRIFKRRVDTSKTATTAAQEAAADREMKKKAADLLKKYKYSEEAWAKASIEERKKILTDYMHDVEKILGVDVSDKINWTYSEPKDGKINQGSYYHPSRQVSINEYVINQKNSYHLMSTIAHEVRHAYQHSAIDNPDQYRVTKETVDSWKESFRTYSREQAKGFESYRNIVVEKDARWFAGQH